jgi:Domain of unknown function (DUF4397)
MSQVLKARTLALAALSLLTVGCSSTNLTQVRVINALSDAPALDVYINTTQITASVAFTQVQPSPPDYRGAPSGTIMLEVFNAGATTDPILNTGTNLTLNGTTQYTLVLDGYYNSPGVVAITDNNTIPTSGNVEFRVIDASTRTPKGGVDVYIVPPDTDITKYTPQISALNNGQGSNYQSLPYTANGYSVIVTANGGKTPLVNQPLTRPSASITTLVLVDNLGGNNGMSQTPVILDDVN